MKAALLFLAATASATPLGTFDIYTVLRGRANSAELIAGMFDDVPEMRAYQLGRAAGLREAEQLVRYIRSLEVASPPDPGLQY